MALRIRCITLVFIYILGKIERLERGSRKTPHQQIMSKLDRRNQAKQKRLFTHQDHTKTTSVFSARYGAPRIVAIVPLCEDVATDAVIQILNKSMDIDQELLTEGRCCVTIDRFKHKVAYVPAKRAVIAAMDACRIADYVVFVLSPEQEVDQLGETIIRAVEGQGVSNVYTVVQVSSKPFLALVISRLILVESRHCGATKAEVPGFIITKIIHHTLFPLPRKSLFTGFTAGLPEYGPLPLHNYTEGRQMAGRAKLDACGRRAVAPRWLRSPG